MMTWQDAFDQCPLVAILRGITPDEVIPVSTALMEQGFTIIEIPLNSPKPLESIQRLSQHCTGRALVGAGTVVNANDVPAVADAGGGLVIAPNMDTEVAHQAKCRAMVYGPGVATVTEALTAIRAGASFLKLFPAEALPPSAVKAIRAVLPEDIPLLPVGGISAETMHLYLDAGARGFGLGSALYTPGLSSQEVSERAARFVAAYRDWTSQ